MINNIKHFKLICFATFLLSKRDNILQDREKDKRWSYLCR